jgi:hypothetical protein
VAVHHVELQVDVGGCAISTLPLDLERQIFETAALSRPVSIPNMMGVAWRVKHWWRDQLDLILFSDPPSYTFFHTVHRKPAPFLRDTVRNVMIRPGLDRASYSSSWIPVLIYTT